MIINELSDELASFVHFCFGGAWCCAGGQFPLPLPRDITESGAGRDRVGVSSWVEGANSFVVPVTVRNPTSAATRRSEYPVDVACPPGERKIGRR